MMKINVKGILVLLSVIFISITVWSQDVLVPVHIQFRLLTSILQYEVSYSERGFQQSDRSIDTSDTAVQSDTINVVDSSRDYMTDTTDFSIHLMIVYQPAYRKSAIIKDKLTSFIKQDNLSSLKGFSLKIIEHPLETMHTFDSLTLAEDIEIIVLAPLFKINWDELFKITQKNDILSFSTVPENIEKGASVSIAVKDNMPQIIINKKSLLAEGLEFREELYANPSVIAYNTE